MTYTGLLKTSLFMAFLALLILFGADYKATDEQDAINHFYGWR